MTDDIKQQTDGRQPRRPMDRGAQRYDVLREAEIVAASFVPQPEELFKITFIVTNEKGVLMGDEKDFLIDLIFEPNAGKLRLRPQETQLLLAHYAELLQEITDEEHVIIEEEKAKPQQGDASCK